ncbi:MAG: sigma-70 family RNA polymerase sigma factor [Kineosporiaceae bacterium]|nr:sigma-70 family RNA polymerase sigma factor [Kineosporiaceae bacterium]
MDPSTLDRFRRGDPEALRTIYQAYAGPVATVARSIVGAEQGLVDDVVQETFLRAWRAAGQFDPARALAPWLFTIARRTAIDVVRSERRPTRGGHEPEVDVAVAPESLESAWERYEIRRAVQNLPSEEQDVVRLAHLAGMTHPEIAERLDIPVGTVKSRSHRAHRRLAAALSHLAGPPLLSADDEVGMRRPAGPTTEGRGRR